MSRTYKNTIAFLFIVALTWGCKPTKDVANKQIEGANQGKASSQLLLKAPINTPNDQELDRAVYANQAYFMVQNESNRFKENAPFIELLDGGTRERLWFSSSRADENYLRNKATNHYQQIYFAVRNVEDGKCPTEGWGNPIRFEAQGESKLIQQFNAAGKGAATVAKGTLILSCDQLEAGQSTEFKNLWAVEVANNSFVNPKPLMTLSNTNTWESQPALSPDGKHLFFVSNRKVDTQNLTYSNDSAGTELNIFYSFFADGEWQAPRLVAELYSPQNETTPHISVLGDKLYFASDRKGDFDIFEVDLKLNSNEGGYTLQGAPALFSGNLVDVCSSGPYEPYQLNGVYNQTYPFLYFNPKNTRMPRALFWSADQPAGYGGYDLYACGMPFKIEVLVQLKDQSGVGSPKIELPIIELSGAKTLKMNEESTSFLLWSHLPYQIKGGSTASPENGTHICDIHPQFIFKGYKAFEANSNAISEGGTLLKGAEVESSLTAQYGNLPLNSILRDTTLVDEILISKVWERKPACPDVLEIPQKHRAIAYFQTGFWEVNTSENLKRDLKLLHEGYEVTPTGDIYNPQGKINFHGSDYIVAGWGDLLYPVKPEETRKYSIANARWIELHPDNYNWGDRPGFSASLEERMKGRKQRIQEYVDFAQKVDENLKVLTDTIKTAYIHFLDLHKENKPKLLIEIFAVSDQREILRGWYIGDTIAYRGSEYLGNNQFKTEQVKIIPPKVNEKTKTVEEIVECSINLNTQGNNGSKLGISADKTELNTNLSRLRAWFGYKEVYARLADSPEFQKMLQQGKVALPDNNVKYEDADIVIITRGRRIDVIDPKNPYPPVNNPNGQGFYDYDQVRRVEVRIRLLMDKKKETRKDFCCE